MPDLAHAPVAGAEVPGAEELATVVVVGAGIAGLAAAHRLRELRPEARVLVLEAGPEPGGVLRSSRREGFLIEHGPDSFITAVPWGLDLCRRLGIEGELLPTDPARRRAFVVRGGRLAPIPDGLMVMAPSRLIPMLTTPILSPAGKLRMAFERFVRPGDGKDESLASFAVRRFGREAFERLIQPLVGGIYTADPEKLSLRATMPRFLDMEREYGSLIRGASQGPKGTPNTGGARYGMFVSPRCGMAAIVDAIVRRLPDGSVRCGTPVDRLSRLSDGRWSLRVGGDRGGGIEADAVIVATPAAVAGRLLGPDAPDLGAMVGAIESAGCAIASLGYRRDQIAHPMDGFGFVVPLVEGGPVLSGSFTSVKFPGRSPEGMVLVRVFLGGACRPEALDLSDEQLLEVAHRSLSRLLGIRGEPVLRHLGRRPGAMPQYHVGHLDRIAAIEARVGRLPGLQLAGNAYRGIGVPHCIRDGERAAEQVAAGLAGGLRRAVASGA
jgi:oxygen-dependent protoporphyrinogen oxidase